MKQGKNYTDNKLNSNELSGDGMKRGKAKMARSSVSDVSVAKVRKLVSKHFDENKIKYSEMPEKKGYVVQIGRDDSGYNLIMVLIEPRFLKVLVTNFSRLKKDDQQFIEKASRILELNKKYRYAKFSVDPSDGEVTITSELHTANGNLPQETIDYCIAAPLLLASKVNPDFTEKEWTTK